MPEPINVSDRGRIHLEDKDEWETGWLNIFTRKVAVAMPNKSDFDCRPFRRFCLLITLNPPSFPSTTQVQVQFSAITGPWFDFVTAPFGNLIWGGGASSISEALVGECIAARIRVNITGAASARMIFST